MRKWITAAAIRQYAEASGDMAAIHLDHAAAGEAGYERPIAHGMYVMGLAQSLYLANLDLASLAEHQLPWISASSMRFQRPLLQDTIANFEFVECGEQVDVKVTSEHGEVIATGSFAVKSVEGGF